MGLSAHLLASSTQCLRSCEMSPNARRERESPGLLRNYQMMKKTTGVTRIARTERASMSLRLHGFRMQSKAGCRYWTTKNGFRKCPVHTSRVGRLMPVDTWICGSCWTYPCATCSYRRLFDCHAGSWGHPCGDSEAYLWFNCQSWESDDLFENRWDFPMRRGLLHKHASHSSNITTP